jgi:hypothetical protein
MVSQDLLHSFFRRCILTVCAARVVHGRDKVFGPVVEQVRVADAPAQGGSLYVFVLPLEFAYLPPDFTFNAINSLREDKLVAIPKRPGLPRPFQDDGWNVQALLSWRELELRLKKAQQIAKHVEIPAWVSKETLRGGQEKMIHRHAGFRLMVGHGTCGSVEWVKEQNQNLDGFAPQERLSGRFIAFENACATFQCIYETLSLSECSNSVGLYSITLLLLRWCNLSLYLGLFPASCSLSR